MYSSLWSGHPLRWKKVGFRSPRYIHRPWGIKQRWLSSLYPAGFPQGNDSIYAAMHFTDRWFPSKNGHNMSPSTLEKHVSPMISSQYFSLGAAYMAKHFIEWSLPFKKGICAATRAFYRKKIAAEHFIESWDASSKSLYRAESVSSSPDAVCRGRATEPSL